MKYLKNQYNKTIKPAVAKTVGGHGRGWLKGHQPRAPDRCQEITATKPKVCPTVRD